MKRVLGEFEHHVLLVTLRLQPAAYTAAIMLELEDRTERDVAPAAVYVTLRRLEDNGLVTSEKRREAEYGGRRTRRYFTLTECGLDMLAASKRRFVRLWEGLDPKFTGTSGS